MPATSQAIWKYELDITDAQVIMMPPGAQILSVANQRGTLCLWALVEPAWADRSDLEARTIEIIGTGNPVERCSARNHLATVVMEPFVWHVFEYIG
jgi:hypothetical protein